MDYLLTLTSAALCGFALAGIATPLNKATAPILARTGLVKTRP